MTSPIEHSLMVLSSVLEKKHNDIELASYAARIASQCHVAGFPGKNGFTAKHPCNKEIEKITDKLDKKYKVWAYREGVDQEEE